MHRDGRRDRGGDQLGAALRHPARIARRARNGTCPICWPSLRRSIWCWSRASSATRFRSSKSTAPPTASRCCIPTIRTSSRSPADTPLPRRQGAGDRPRTTSRRSSTCCSSTPCRCRAPPPRCGARDGAAHRRLLRVLRAAAADRRDGADDRRARAAGDRDRNACRSPARAAACWPPMSSRRSTCRRSTIPRSMATRCATRDLDAKAETTARGRRTADRRAAPPARPIARGPGRSASSPARRCRRAPTPCSCRRTCAPRRDAVHACRPGSRPAPTAGLPARTCAKARSCCRPAGGSPRRTWRSPPRSA